MRLLPPRSLLWHGACRFPAKQAPRSLGMSPQGQIQRFPTTRLNGGRPLEKATFAGPDRNGRGAPSTAVRRIGADRQGSTLSRRSRCASGAASRRTEPKRYVFPIAGIAAAIIGPGGRSLAAGDIFFIISSLVDVLGPAVIVYTRGRTGSEDASASARDAGIAVGIRLPRGTATASF